MLQWLVLLVLVALLRVPAHAADDFLPPEKAFRFSATQVDGQTVEVRFGIAAVSYTHLTLPTNREV